MAFTELELQSGEKLLLQGAANKWQRVGSKGGMLFLTNQRLVFKAHALNFGSKVDSYELSEIETEGNTLNIKVSSNLISFNIKLKTKSGEEISFVVTRKQKDAWIDGIIDAVTSYAQQGISFPEDISENERQIITTQIRAVLCEGCGAVVIVKNGTASKCDYCGRPCV